MSLMNKEIVSYETK